MAQNQIDVKKVLDVKGQAQGSMKNQVGSTSSSESDSIASAPSSSTTTGHWAGNTLSSPSSNNLIFSNSESRTSEGLFDNLAERKTSKEVDDQAKSLILEHLATVEYELGNAVSKGDCFFDAVGQGLLIRNIAIPPEYQGQFVYKRLRQLCEKYAKSHQKDATHWLKMQFVKENAIHQDYLMAIGYTAPEVEAMWKRRELPSGVALWGRPDIDGRIICEVLKVKLHVIELMVVENQVVMAHQLIDANGSKQLIDNKKISEIYNDNRVVHLAGYQNALHWVPILTKLAKDKNKGTHEANLVSQSIVSSSSSSSLNHQASAVPLPLNFGPNAQPITSSYPLESSWNQAQSPGQQQPPIAVKPKVDAEQVQMFLDYIAFGQIDKAAAMLKENKDLALASGDITDYAKRTFKNITGFQYAVWALNTEMWAMILPYLTPEAAKEQAQGFKTGSWVKDHAEHVKWDKWEKSKGDDPSALISTYDNLVQLRSELVTGILHKELIFSSLAPVRLSGVVSMPMPYPVMSIVAEYDGTWRELQTFLNHIARGRQDEAEAMVRANQDLVLAYGDITDHAGRTFRGITGFQYAVWALDWKMWTMLHTYLTPEAAKEQAKGFKEGSWVKEHAEHANWKNLTDALQVYLDKFNSWDWDQREKHWIEQVGDTQFKLPMHVLQEYNNPNRPFEPCPKFDVQYPLQRSLPDWLEKGITVAKFDFGILRSNFDAAGGFNTWWRRYAPFLVLAAADRGALIRLYDIRIEQRSNLEAQILRGDLSQNALSRQGGKCMIQ